MDTSTRHIKFESDCDPGFPAEIKKLPGCERIDACIQCGTCSGMCPLSTHMDMPPRRVMNLLRAGFKTEVMKSNTIWLCSSCYACTVECPREIGITNVMYALKSLAIREGIYPRRFAMPVLAQEFSKMVRDNGRINEGRLVSKLYMKTNWLKMLQSAKLGFHLMRSGRFPVKQDRIKGRDQLRRILDYDKRNGKEGVVR